MQLHVAITLRLTYRRRGRWWSAETIIEFARHGERKARAAVRWSRFVKRRHSPKIRIRARRFQPIHNPSEASRKLVLGYWTHRPAASMPTCARTSQPGPHQESALDRLRQILRGQPVRDVSSHGQPPEQ